MPTLTKLNPTPNPPGPYRHSIEVFTITNGIWLKVTRNVMVFNRVLRVGSPGSTGKDLFVDVDLLPDAERAENTVKNVIGIDSTNNFPQLRKSISRFGCDQFITAPGRRQDMCPLDGRQGESQAFATSNRRRRHHFC